jgi:hypothetical protein
MKFVLLLIVLYRGEVRYKVEEFDSIRECRDFSVILPALLPKEATVFRNECITLGGVKIDR